MDLGTDYRYAGVPLALYPSSKHLGKVIWMLYVFIECLLSARCLLSKGGAEPFVQAGDSACQVKRGQLLCKFIERSGGTKYIRRIRQSGSKMRPFTTHSYTSNVRRKGPFDGCKAKQAPNA